MTLFGRARDHELFAGHITASETWTPTQGHGRIMRRRECRHCGKRVTTWETAGG